MSKDFILSSWLCRLPSRFSCIDGDHKRGGLEWQHDLYEQHNFDYYGGFGNSEVSGGYVKIEPVRRYYALAEDGMGHHLPYPLLPNWAKRLFDWRVAWGNLPQNARRRVFSALATLFAQLNLRNSIWAFEVRYQLSHHVGRTLGRFILPCPYRGETWRFCCPTPGCKGQSTFSYRNTFCRACGNEFDSDLQVCGTLKPVQASEWDDSDPWEDVFADE